MFLPLPVSRIIQKFVDELLVNIFGVMGCVTNDKQLDIGDDPDDDADRDTGIFKGIFSIAG